MGWATPITYAPTWSKQALRSAVTARRPTGVIFQSDRGVQESGQSISAQFTDATTKLGARLSVGRTGQSWNNTLADSFLAG